MQHALILCISITAVITDIWKGKIPNALIVTGFVIGWNYQAADKGIPGLLVFLGGAAVPVLLLAVLFFFRMLGAGDIKLLAVLGGFMGASAIFSCIAAAILSGGIISMILVLKRRNLKRRIRYFISYFQNYSETKEWRPYRKEEASDSHFYFSVPILISVILYIGGIY